MKNSKSILAAAVGAIPASIRSNVAAVMGGPD
jgi:hypothetical protein